MSTTTTMFQLFFHLDVNRPGLSVYPLNCIRTRQTKTALTWKVVKYEKESIKIHKCLYSETQSEGIILNLKT